MLKSLQDKPLAKILGYSALGLTAMMGLAGAGMLFAGSCIVLAALTIDGVVGSNLLNAVFEHPVTESIGTIFKDTSLQIIGSGCTAYVSAKLAMFSHRKTFENVALRL